MNTIIASALLGVLLMLAGVFLRNERSIKTLAVMAAVALLGVALYELYTCPAGNTFHFKNMLHTNSFTAKMMALIALCSMLYFFLFPDQISKVGRNDAEYFALILFAICGIGLLITYQNLFMLFLGIEILSIPQYILAGSDKRSMKSNEAALKYFLMGAFSTGILLMGITLLYGASGSFDIDRMQLMLAGSKSTIAMLGLLFSLVALSFKASAAPFHVWTPDVYDGTPTAFTPFMASVAKVGVMVAFVSLFHSVLAPMRNQWQVLLIAIICATLLIGNITAVYQQSVKRMLAYSSIAQAGFMLFAVYSSGVVSQKGLLLYGTSYMLATMVIFAVLIHLKDFTYDGFNGLAKQQPTMAFAAAIAICSLAGIPLTGGFFGKYYMLSSALQNGMPLWVLIFAVLMAAVSVYYYFKVIRAMYFQEASTPCIDNDSAIDGPFKYLLLIASITSIALGIVPQLATWF